MDQVVATVLQAAAGEISRAMLQEAEALLADRAQALQAELDHLTWAMAAALVRASIGMDAEIHVPRDAHHCKNAVAPRPATAFLGRAAAAFDRRPASRHRGAVGRAAQAHASGRPRQGHQEKGGTTGCHSFPGEHR